MFAVARDTLKFIWQSRRKGIDTTINLEIFTRFGSILTYLSGARKRVGFYRYRQEGLYVGDFFTHGSFITLMSIPRSRSSHW